MKETAPGRLTRRISIRQLQVFEAVARLMSYTRAAEELHLSQPTVSMQINKLESDYRVSINRESRQEDFADRGGQCAA